MEPEHPEYNDKEAASADDEPAVPENAGPQNHVAGHEHRLKNELLDGEEKAAQNSKM